MYMIFNDFSEEPSPIKHFAMIQGNSCFLLRTLHPQRSRPSPRETINALHRPIVEVTY
jgi:hypothetical protein